MLIKETENVLAKFLSHYKYSSLSSKSMNHKLQQCLIIETGKPSPVENPVGRYLVKEGKNLPNSVTEDIGGFSLCPSYSAKQQRRIHRISVSVSERKPERNFRNKTRGGGL